MGWARRIKQQGSGVGKQGSEVRGWKKLKAESKTRDRGSAPVKSATLVFFEKFNGVKDQGQGEGIG
jgi:hypothetical protein